jgi:hypothetical protein
MRCAALLAFVAISGCSGSDPSSPAAPPQGSGDFDAGLGQSGDGGASPSGDGDSALHKSNGKTSPDASSDAASAAFEPIVEIPQFTTLYAISDVHAHYAEFSALLLKYNLIASVPSDPNGMTWTGGEATLVVNGDMIDKGPASLEVIEAVMALQTSALSSGGTVIALLGNHEAEFMGDPTGSKFQGSDRIDGELAAQTPAIDPNAFASGADPRGAWVAHLPFGARVGSWFFSHAGDTGGSTVTQLDTALSAAAASSQGWSSSAIVGPGSLLESRGWYSPSVVTANLTALGAKHIVMGHDPNAFGSVGQILAPSAYAGSLVKLDTGLGAGASTGALLRVRHAEVNDVAEALLPDGTTTQLWAGP